MFFSAVSSALYDSFDVYAKKEDFHFPGLKNRSLSLIH